MNFYRKRPVVIEAVQLLWTTWNEMCDHADVGTLDEGKPTGGYSIPGTFEFVDTGHQPTADHVLALAIPTLEGLMIAHEGDWIIKGVQGELYPCKPDVFAATYESAATTDGPADDAWIARAVHPQQRPQPYYDGGRLTDGGGAS